MAKVTAPLFSFSARGALAESLVYFPWKGINAVRQYVVPANPNTTAQQTQRGYLEDAVDEWHLSKYDAADKTAWGRYAAILAKPMSGFNAFVKSWIDLIVGGVAVADPGHNGSIVGSGVALFNAHVEEDGEADEANIVWGYSKTAMNTTHALAEAANVWTRSFIDATSGATVYARFQIKLLNELIGETGIFQLLIT